jgi:hypothetical protein
VPSSLERAFCREENFAKIFYQLNKSNDSIINLLKQYVKGFYLEMAMASG